MVHDSGYRVQGFGFRQLTLRTLRFRVQKPGVRVHGPGFRVQGPGIRIHGSGFRVQGSGFKVQGSGFRVQVPRVDRLRVGEVSRGGKMLYPGTKPESYSAQYASIRRLGS